MKYSLEETQLASPDSRFAEILERLAPVRIAFAAVIILLGASIATRAQSALDGFDPDANGLVRAVIVQPDGKILLGGDFTTLSPNGAPAVPRNRIARLNPDGTLDSSFNPNANGSVYAIAVQTDGKILAGGVFTTLAPNGGAAVTRNRLARLNVDGTLDTDFDPNANNAVLSIAVQADRMILAGGDFTSIAGQPRNRMGRLDAVTGAADSFNPNVNSSVWSIVVRADGKMIVGGSFTDIGGQVRNSMARLNPDATLDPAFNPNANGSIRAIAVQADGSIVAGGQFTTIGGQTRNRIARLHPMTGVADSFDPNASSDVRSVAIQPDGKIVAGGFFFTIGGQSRSQIARLNSDGTADSFNPAASSPVHALGVQQDGKILAGGTFTSIGGQARNRIARLETDGRLYQPLDLGIVGNFVYATAVQPDGKILIGGDFSTVLGVPRNNMARLNPDGTLDTAFNPNVNIIAINSTVDSIAVQADGSILVGGYFFRIGGVMISFIARLGAVDGTVDTTFHPNPNGLVGPIVVQPDGKILVGGSFTNIGGKPRNRIARLDAINGEADSFNPDANDSVASIAVQADGRILAGGSFTSIGGQPRNRIARLDDTTGAADSFNPDSSNVVHMIVVQADGKILTGAYFSGSNSIGGQQRNRIARLDAATGAADSFNPNPSSFVDSIALQADGKILVGGAFSGPTSIGGQPRYCIARFDATTGLVDSYSPVFYGPVYSIGVQPDGMVLAGGYFQFIGGQTRKYFARLSNDTGSLQNLAVSQNTITWTRGGSSPQLTRATFEYSTNNVNYTPLGNGTPAGSNWTLTGLNLSTGQNLYIRARGFYRGGYLTGSESITESVRNVFLGPSPRINSIARLTGGSVELRGIGTPNATHPLEAAPDLTPLSFMSLGNVTPNEQGNWLFLDPAASGQPKRFYRLAVP